MTIWLCTGGTALRSRRGLRGVEALAPGDAVALCDGRWAEVAWIGRQRLSPPEPAGLSLVQVAAGALGDASPQADTLVLPDTPLTVPALGTAAAKWLLDGQALRPIAATAPLDIFTLEIDSPSPPDALCQAENAPAERPEDAVLFALRCHITLRASAPTGPSSAGALPGPLHGSLDAVDNGFVGGWIADDGGRPLAVEVVVDGLALPPVLADRFRADLAAAGIGDGHHAFRVVFDPPLSRARRHLIRVRRATDGADLPGSPAVLDGVPMGEHGLAAVLDQLCDLATLRPAVEDAVRLLAARLQSST